MVRLEHYVASSQLQIVHAAIAEGAGSVTFYVNRTNPQFSTSSPSWEANNRDRGFDSYPIEVPVVSLVELARTYGSPTYVKIDIEGSDLLCLRQLAEIAPKPQFVSIECSLDSAVSARLELTTFKTLGYCRFQLVNQRRISRLRSLGMGVDPRSAGAGAVIGRSGRPGDELGGRWCTALEIRVKLWLVRRHHQILGHRGMLNRTALGGKERRFDRLTPSWYDLHARHQSVTGRDR